MSDTDTEALGAGGSPALQSPHGFQTSDTRTGCILVAPCAQERCGPLTFNRFSA